MGVENLGYVRLEMRDPEGWAVFAENVLGFVRAVVKDPSGAQYLRMDEAPFRYIIEKGDRDRFLTAGYEMASKTSFEAICARLESYAVNFCRGTADEAKRRAVAGFASFTDPSGNIVEIYHGRATGSEFSPGCDISAYKTGAMGLGHLVLPATENEATEDFYREVMGFGVSDDLALPPPAEGLPGQRILFMHADNPRHHTLGLYNFPNPTGVIHLMAEVSSIDEVGACMDRVKQAGLHIFASLGRHANDEMVSFYFFAPGGIGFEVGYDGRQIEDWSQFIPTKSTIGDIWGHEYDFPVMGEG